MTSLRILQLYPKSDYFTGAAIQLRDLAIGLARRGHAVTVATSPNPHWAGRLRAAGIGHVEIPMRRAWDVRAAWRIARLIRARDIQVVHAHKGRARTLTLLAGLMGAHAARAEPRRQFRPELDEPPRLHEPACARDRRGLRVDQARPGRRRRPGGQDRGDLF